MAIIGTGVDFNGDGSADGFVGCVVGGVESVCGKTFAPDARLLFEQYLDLPKCPCVLLRCGFCKEDSVAYADCPWCGEKDTWRHNRNIKFNSGWLECSRCLKRLGDNPCPRCKKTNDVKNFHLLKYESDEKRKAKLDAQLEELEKWRNAKGLLGWFFRRQAESMRSDVEPFIYVMTPHPFLIGPVQKIWLMCRVTEDPANLVWQFSGSLKGPWESAKDLLDFLQRLQRLKPAPRSAEPSAAAALPASTSNESNTKGGGDANATPQPTADTNRCWVRTPQGKRGGPFTKEQITKAIAAGKIPEGSEAASSPDGPWQKIRGKTGS